MATLPMSNNALSLLSRVTYGLNQELVQAFLSLGKDDTERWKKFVDDQLSSANFIDEKVEKKIATLDLKVLNKPLNQLWREHNLSARAMRQTPAEKAPSTKKELRAARRERRDLALEPVQVLEAATWIRMVHSRWQVYERMVEFWHDHFNIFGYEQRTAPGLLALNRDAIRPMALGNFRALLGQACRNPALLYYLDNAYNQSSNPNENFSRELFELHTLGAENYLGTLDRESVEKGRDGFVAGYVDGDVYESARAFTGWRVADGSVGLDKNTGEFHYHEPWHDRFQKIVLGQKIPEHQAPLKDGEDVLNALSAHPGTARHLMRKLCRRFVSDTPTEVLVNRLAEFWLSRKDSPTQIKDTLLQLFYSKEFLEGKDFKFKRPVDYFASLLRILSPDFSPSEKFIQATQKSGQRLFGWKTPDGPPDVSAPWQSPQSLLDRWRTAQQIIRQEVPGCPIKWPDTLKVSETSPQILSKVLFEAILMREPDKQFLETLTLLAAGGRRTQTALPTELLEERIQLVAELCVLSPEFQVRS